MIQPFIPFELNCLRQLQALGAPYLVSQPYDRVDHFMDQGKIHLLITDYKDLGLAKVHYNAVRSHRYAAIINLEKQKHLNKLTEMMAGNEYEIYWSVVQSRKDLERRLRTVYKTKLRKYIEHRTSWRVHVYEQVQVTVEVIFGELFLHAKWRAQRLRVKFAEIERY